jgi:hypothetical protein
MRPVAHWGLPAKPPIPVVAPVVLEDAPFVVTAPLAPPLLSPGDVVPPMATLVPCPPEADAVEF